MALTALPQSTISYNSEDFLIRKLTELFDAGRVDDFRAIHHDGEGGDKDHFHVFIVPSRRMDTTALRSDFNEIDLEHPEKPLGVMPFRKSSPDDWLMYAIHDPAYLASHSRSDEAQHKIQYSLEDIYTPFPEQLERDFRRAVALRRTDNQIVVELLNKGLRVVDIITQEDLNPLKVNAIYHAWKEALDAEVRASYQRARLDKNIKLPIQVSAGALLPEGYGEEDNPFTREGGKE